MAKIPANLPASTIDVTKYQDMWAIDNQHLDSISKFISKGDFVSWFISLFTDTSNAVTSVMTYPFSLTRLTDSTESNIMIAGKPATIAGDIVTAKRLHSTVAIPVAFEYDVPMPEDLNFLHFEPFTKYQIYIPFVGVTNLDGRNILGKKLKLEYCVDFHTGGCSVYLHNGDITLYTTSFQIGTAIPFGATNEGDAKMQRTLGAVKTGLTLGFMGTPITKTTTTSGQINTANGAVATGGKTITTPTRTVAERYKVVFDKKMNEIPNAAESGKSSTTTTIRGGSAPPQANTLANGILNIASDKESYIAGAPGGDFSQFTCGSTPYLLITETNIHEIEEYGKYFGYACAENIKLGDHHGYCELSNIHMEGLPDTLEDECDAIADFLKTGVILP